jgi:hypothetical protein
MVSGTLHRLFTDAKKPYHRLKLGRAHGSKSDRSRTVTCGMPTSGGGMGFSSVTSPFPAEVGGAPIEAGYDPIEARSLGDSNVARVLGLWPSLDTAGGQSGDMPEPAVNCRQQPGEKMDKQAATLWSCDYRAEYAKEEEGYVASGMLALAAQLVGAAPASTYLRQGRAGEPAALARDLKGRHMMMRWCGEAAHEKNRHHLPFSVLSRSVAHLGHGYPSTSWAESGTVTSRKTAIDAVHAMMRQRPPSRFQQDERIGIACFDQVYRVKDCGAKKNKSTAAEKIDGTGNAKTQHRRTVLRTWESQTYVNVVRVRVPVSLANLNQADVDQLREVGPFIGAWDQVYPLLHPDTVCCRSSLPQPNNPAPRYTLAMMPSPIPRPRL